MLESNNLYFEKQTKATTRADHINSVTPAKKYPCLKLVFNNDWDDYGNSTWFSLWLLRDVGTANYHYIGDFKMMHRNGDVYGKLPENFDKLTNEFCSVGLNISYYKNLRALFKRSNVMKILKALRDCAIDKNIYEQFCTHVVFTNSLVRDLATERAIKEAPFVVDGRKPEDAYSFEYTFHPIFNKESFVKWKVNIDYEPVKYKRTFGLIGENGVGKTQMLTHCVDALIKRNKEILNNQPMFASIFVVCSSVYDAYNQIDRNESELPLYVCTTEQGESMVDNLEAEINAILERPTFYHDRDLETMREVYQRLLEEELGKATMNGLIIEDILEYQAVGHTKFKPSTLKLQALVKELSSGQLQMFALITYICAHIHLASLLIVDEPEVHLHPRLVTDFIRLLNKLLNLFESYAIILTHSPLVIREIVGENVYLMRRSNENQPLLGKVAYETFGEDISALYYNIFGCEERNSYFASVVNELASKRGATYERVTKKLKDSGVKMLMNSGFIIQQTLDSINRNTEENA